MTPYQRLDELERQIDKLFSRIKYIENLLIIMGVSVIVISVFRGLS